MHQKSALVVHFNDLRITDHRPLVEAAACFDVVYAMVVVDPRWMHRSAQGSPRMSARRFQWFCEGVKDLRSAYRSRGGDLIIRVGDTAQEIRDVAQSLGVQVIYGQQAKTSEEISTRKEIEDLLDGVTCQWRWNDVLVDPNQLPTPASTFPRSFTGFRKKFEQSCTVPFPLDAPISFESVPIDPGPLPTVEDLGFELQPIDIRSPIAKLTGGETGAWQQLEHYIWQGDHLRDYKQTRNGMTEWNDSSKLSPYLALGLISPRSIYHQVLAYEQERVANQSTYWLKFELLWREYFHALGLFCGHRLFMRSGVQQREMSWVTDVALFDRWKTGQTGCPIVDACMRELAQTGYTSNRARQIAASFLVRYLRIDWRWGAAWFEHHLIDYDPCSNWGNWQYLAGVGTDSKDRVFSMRKQAKYYDVQAKFTKRWLPEFRHHDAEAILAANPWGPDDWPQRQAFWLRQTAPLTASGH